MDLSIDVRDRLLVANSRFESSLQSEAGAVFAWHLITNLWYFVRRVQDTVSHSSLQFGEGLAVAPGGLMFAGSGQANATATAIDSGAAFVFDGSRSSIQLNDPSPLDQLLRNSFYPTQGQFLGSSMVFISSQLVAVGGSGAVYFFEQLMNGTWAEAGNTSIFTQGLPQFGYHVTFARTLNQLFVGQVMSRNTSVGGAVFVYRYNPSLSPSSQPWPLVQEFFASPTIPKDSFGNLIEVNGNFALVSSYGFTNSSLRYVSLFIWNTTTSQWALLAKIRPVTALSLSLIHI